MEDSGQPEIRMKVKESMKYNSIMNTSNLGKSCALIGPTATKKLMELECVVTEKIHGENFRVGVDTSGCCFMGSRNLTFYVRTCTINPATNRGELSMYDEHPNWNRMGDDTQQMIIRLLHFCNEKFMESGDSFVFFGELCGNGMQSGFTYPWDKLKVLYFDVMYTPKDEDGYYMRHRDAYYWMDYNGVPRVPVVATKLTVAQALKLNVEKMKSEVAESDFIEGVVIKPVDRDKVMEVWNADSRFIIKLKTERYSEQKQRKVKHATADISSPFCDFVTVARIEHAIEKLNEIGECEIKYELADLRYIRNEVVADIIREENNGEPLSDEDVKSLNKFIPKVYKELLDIRTSSILNIG